MPSPITRLSRHPLIPGVLLLLVTLLAYFPAWNGKPLWDDDGHMTAPELRSLAGLGHIWTKLGATQQYYPLVHTVFWIEHRLWGDAPLGYHLLNIFLHALSAFLLYRVLRRLTIPGAWFAAALFALHPIEVESVAWISELKNCLSGVFFFAAILSYLRFDDTRAKRSFITALALFALGLMAKTAIAPLPAALIAILWWKREQGGRLGLKRDLLPLLPFFVAGISFGLFTAWVERTYIIADVNINFNYGLPGRGLIAGRAIWFYLGKLIAPFNLIFSYPRWAITPESWAAWLYPLAALLLAAACWMFRGRSRAPFAVLLYFIAMLFPALGFFNIFPFRYSFVADHFQYLAGVGPMVLASAALSRTAARISSRGFSRALRLLPVAALPVLAGLTLRQAGMFADGETLYRTTILRNPSSWMGWDNLGLESLHAGNLASAITSFRRSVELYPYDFESHSDLGIALMDSGLNSEALDQFRLASAIRPADDQVLYNLGKCLAGCGRLDEAVVCYRKALTLRPESVEALVNLGHALVLSGQAREGIAMFRKALTINPASLPALLNLGRLMMQTGSLPEAMAYYRAALDQNPAELTILNELCAAFMQLSDPDDAIRAARKARSLAHSTGREELAKEIEGNIEEMKQVRSQESGAGINKEKEKEQ
jgi:Flp pilus assembly protein TadD